VHCIADSDATHSLPADIQAQGRAADYESMPISATSGCSDTAASLEVQRQIAVMKKTADAQKSQAEGLVELVKQSAPERPGVGGRLDVYA
jgi:hypothetical protein